MEVQAYKTYGINSAGEEVPSIRVDIMMTHEENERLVGYGESVVIDMVKEAARSSASGYIF